MNDQEIHQEVERLMALAKTNRGTLGFFATIPHLQSSGAATGYNEDSDQALVELRASIRKNLASILEQEKKEEAAK